MHQFNYVCQYLSPFLPSCNGSYISNGGGVIQLDVQIADLAKDDVDEVPITVTVELMDGQQQLLSQDISGHVARVGATRAAMLRADMVVAAGVRPWTGTDFYSLRYQLNFTRSPPSFAFELKRLTCIRYF
jgi:hypothetical protein